MRESLFKMFGSVRLVQEVTRSSSSQNGSSLVEASCHNDNRKQDDEEEEIIDNNTNRHIDTSSIDCTITTSNNDKQQQEQQQEQEQTIIDNKQQIMQHTIQHQPIFSCWSNTIQPIPIHHVSNNLFSSLTSNNNNRTATLPPPSRKSFSKYTIRHYRNKPTTITTATTTTTTNRPTTTGQQQRYILLEQEERQKSKSQKLLCLWPLPIVTRYIILIALFVSTLNSLNLIQLSCSAPSYVIHRLDFKNLILSPFLVDWTLPSMALFGWNVLILGLFEESLAHMIGGTHRFIQLLFTLFSLVSAIRILFGFLFSKSTGWALPALFFSNSMHECSQGLAPFLFALLVIQSLSIDDKYILIYGQQQDGHHHKLTVRKVTLQLVMCLINYTTRNILWWSVSGLTTGFLMTILIQTILAREKRQDAVQVKDANEFISLEKYRRTPLWRLVWSALQKSVLVCFVTMPILMIWNAWYTHEYQVTSTELNTVSQDPYLFTMVFMTAPRRGDPAYLTRTIESYLENWPEYPTSDSPYRRMQAIIFTHFSTHAQYDLAQSHFATTVKGQRYLKWVREPGDELNQRLHVAKALEYVTDQYQSTYYSLMEDDFPVCGSHAWHEIENVVYKAEKNVPHHCGVFVGTGGSGLFLKPDWARLAARLLLKYNELPPDIIIQKCLRGELEECVGCTDSLVTSKTLLMYHIGYNTSTSQDRVYKKDEFQCGWRHPFNGDPGVITL